MDKNPVINEDYSSTTGFGENNYNLLHSDIRWTGSKYAVYLK
jgi:hypothetical protein